MLDFIKNKNNVLKEFMLEENEREVLQKVGKYSIYDIDDEVEEILNEFVKMLFEDKNDDRVNKITSSDEFMIKILGLMTDLPKEILTLDNYNKIKNNQKKLFRDICFAVSNVISEYIRLFTKRYKNIADDLALLDDKGREKYFEKLTNRKND